MPKYRVSLGRKTSGGNKISNGGFSSGLTDWNNPSGNWAVLGGLARVLGNNARDLLWQASLSEGKRYRISYEYTLIPDGVVTNASTIEVALGDYVIAKHSVTTGGGIILDNTIEFLFLSGMNFNIYGRGDGASYAGIDKIVATELVPDDPLECEPEGLDKLSRIISRENDRISGIITSKSLSDLTFIGDGFEYFDNLRKTSFCSVVPIYIEKSCGGGQYETIFRGQIGLIEVKFDFQNCEAKAKIDDRSGRRLLNKLENVKTSLVVGQGDHPFFNLLYHDSTGAYPLANPYLGSAYNVGLLFKRILLTVSNLELNVESDFFSSGTFEHFAIVQAYVISVFSNNGLQEVISFKELYDELNKVFNLGIIITYVGDVPTVKIEPKEDLFDNTVALALTNVVRPELTYDLDFIYKTIQIGYDTILASDYDKGTQYVADDVCSQDPLLLTSGFVQDSALIFGMLASSGTYPSRFSSKWVLVENDGTHTTQFNRVGEGGTAFDYNGNIDPDDNMLRWLFSVQSSVIGEFGDTIVKTNDSLVEIWDFETETTVAEFELLETLIKKISFTSPSNGIEIPKEGYILNLDREEDSGFTKIQAIVEI